MKIKVKENTMVNQIKSLIAVNAKAIAALVATVVVTVAGDRVEVPAEVLVAIQALVVAVVVWVTRNR